jgi:hypothetical protein
MERFWPNNNPPRKTSERYSVKIDYNRAAFAELARSGSGEFEEGEGRISIPQESTLRSERNR